ncbi:hypothetical protein FHX82_001801 [Amycolatopsis bartoniae]|uniref:Uncharacterized protein n=1 Tax=Amycolatopsis bartoniae TaxID=941986 RepID=A0A8H9IVG0_9PSEU|nr:hypothetical protein [Amycolatopsis bartoniae]MBB2934781.1 hypothetical protein [Amycolatopsis bartoniae]TVT02430.1 hypothetical protein FNH07_27345 [Amycolatopsis bartoniae]GHF44773.1 hypothetical protein GCM10017566_17250 [Amycolatopsis bartoniae]
MNRNAARQALDVLVAEPGATQLLVRHREEPPSRVPDGPAVPGQLIVSISERARQVPAFLAALPTLLGELPDGVESVWIGLPGLAGDPAGAQLLAKELELDVVAPDGPFLDPEAGRYAGHGTGGTGWWRFRADGPAGFAGLRCPSPRWEALVPRTTVTVDATTVVDPVPAGLYARTVGAPAVDRADVAFSVPFDGRFPKVVVGGGDATPSPASIATVLNRLADGDPLLVPMTAEVTDHIWQAELALRTGRDVRFASGVPLGPVPSCVLTAEGKSLFQPFPTVLRQTAGGGDQHVLDIAPPPAGWTRSGPRSYRLGDGDTAVFADVVPSGLVLRAASAECAAEVAPFDPTGWTLQLGNAGDPVGVRLLVATERLLAALDPGRRAVVRVRVAGTLDEQAAAVLHRMSAGVQPAGRAPSVASGPARPSAPAPQAPVQPRVQQAPAQPQQAPVQQPPAPAKPAAPPRPAGALDPRLLSAPPSIAMMSTSPVSTVSEPPRAVEEAPAEPDITEFVPPPAPVEPEPVAPEPAEAEPVAEEVPEEEPVEQAPVAEEPEPVPSQPTGEQEPLKPLVLADRPSTSAEQARFAAAAGDAFSEALATVNAALAAWPSMRQGDTSDAKADYVAVCLYLGRGEASAAQLNGAVRAGQKGGLDGQLQCLVSGIRRLPTHRRAVLRQGKVGESLEHASTPGTLLSEPGFLTASMDLDVTVPGADLDVLIWPASARRTSELMVSRPMNEVVFAAGARFKALAVRTAAEGEEETEEGEEGPAAPRVAVLFRELAPGEQPDTELDERDLAVLAKLDQVLARRQQATLRLVEDPDVAARLTTSLVEWQPDVAEELSGHTVGASR